MADQQRKLIRRSAEERIAEIDKKIAGHEKALATLRAKKEAILNPKPRPSKSARMKAISTIAKETGMSEEEVIKKLGIGSEDGESTESEGETE